MLNVNDKVRIRKDLYKDVKYDDIYCHNGMCKFAGKEVTIGNFPFEEKRKDIFYIKEDLEMYLWTSEMLERYDE